LKISILSPDLPLKIDTYWRAANYLSVWQTYLYNNPLLKDKLREHKQYINKHGQDLPKIRRWRWGTTQSQALMKTSRGQSASLGRGSASSRRVEPLGYYHRFILRAYGEH
jgi:hypothetical protein